MHLRRKIIEMETACISVHKIILFLKFLLKEMLKFIFHWNSPTLYLLNFKSLFMIYDKTTNFMVLLAKRKHNLKPILLTNRRNEI